MRNIFTPVLLFISSMVSAQDGTLASWGNANSGKVTAPVPGDVFAGTSKQKIVVLADNSTLQSFSLFNGTNNDFGVAKYDANGDLVTGFGGNNTGYAIIDFGGTDDQASSLAVQSDGKIVIAGTSYASGPGGAGSFAVTRLNTDGTLDNSFGNNGIFTTQIGVDDQGRALLIQPDGKIVVGGSTTNASAISSFGLIRLNTNGSLDGSFGSSGKVMTTIATLALIESLVYDTTNNKIIAGGFSQDGDPDFTLARYLASNGALDNTFGTSGIVITDFNGISTEDLINSVAINSTGKIIAAGYTINASNYDFALAQYTSAGALDPSFGVGGKVSTNFGANEIGYELGLQTDNRIILMGTKFSGAYPGSDNDFAIARYQTTGAVDPSFGVSATGMNTIDFGGNDIGYSMAMTRGYIMTGGITNTTVNSPGGPQLALALLQNFGSLLPVHMISFAATKETNSVLLNWQTTWEAEVASFEVQKSIDGIHFEKIGWVPASGATASIKNYSFRDGQAIQSTNFYRLRIINSNLTWSYSGIVAVKSSAHGLLVFPNPVGNTLTIQFTEPKGPVRIRVADVTGRTVKSIQLYSAGNTLSTSIDLQQLQNGIYFIIVNDKTTRVLKK